jgi:hypothetical protein
MKHAASMHPRIESRGPTDAVWKRQFCEITRRYGVVANGRFRAI